MDANADVIRFFAGTVGTVGLLIINALAAEGQVDGWPVLVLCALGGLCLGSFLNVLVHRLPIMVARQWRGEALSILHIRPAKQPRFDLMLPRSRCPACAAAVAPWDNIPVLSWLLLRGRCRKCSAAIPWRYPLVELAGAAIALASVGVWGVTWLAASYCALLLALLALALIDFDTLLLPDPITMPLAWLGVLASFAFGETPAPRDAVLGAVGGYLLLWLFYWGHKLLTRREGMGYGDFKLLAALGAWLGWQAILPVTLIASALGLFYALTGLLRGTADRATPIPFGSFLCIGGAATLFFARYLTLAY